MLLGRVGERAVERTQNTEKGMGEKGGEEGERWEGEERRDRMNIFLFL